MICQLLINAPDGSCVKARGLLDSASSTSFVSERLAKALHLPQTSHKVSISGVAGLSHQSSLHPVTEFQVSAVSSPSERFKISAVVVPRVTCDLPVLPVPFNSKWTHLFNLQLADPDFGQPGRLYRYPLRCGHLNRHTVAWQADWTPWLTYCF